MGLTLLTLSGISSALPRWVTQLLGSPAQSTVAPAALRPHPLRGSYGNRLDTVRRLKRADANRATTMTSECIKRSVDLSGTTPAPASSARPIGTLRMVRTIDADLPAGTMGRFAISGRMADVCAELDRLAAHECCGNRPGAH